ncbi:putative aspartyl protease [Gymnopilus junonius]|uniref:Aspartyl protease n=1 Tax=Gymnopilus junonius TaxID=109634 RepID=A0A9P5NM75_GYMJU|nr:putative aspartyl protease [Gymnopilus junonius]
MKRAIIAGVAALSAASATVLDLKISIRNTYSVVHVNVGTPAVDHALLYDTGSSTLWLVDSTCTTTNCPNFSGFNRTTYNVSASRTGQEYSSVPGSIDYSGGYVSGVLASDIAKVSYTSFKQTFAAITYSTWSTLPADGFLGLASSSIAFPNTTSFFENLMNLHLADQPRFGLYPGSGVSTVANPSPANNGILTFGGSREAEYACGKVKFVDLEVPFQVYKTPLQALTIINKSGNQTKTYNQTWSGDVVVDTGSGSIYVPQDYIEDIYSATPWTFANISHGYRPLCTDFTDDWSVALTLGFPGAEQTYTVTGSMLAVPGYVDDEHCFPPFNYWSSQNIIVGANWLRNFYSVFDYGSFDPEHYNVRIGFAPLKPEYLPKV